MPRKSVARKALEKLARKRSRGYPIATIAYYGPTDKMATKVAVGIVDQYEKIIALERWFSTNQDVRRDEAICEQIVAFLNDYNVQRVGMADRIIGCPHEEGIDYPEGEFCPQCTFWIGRDRWTGVHLQ
jgi:hypothetical protein